MPTYQYTCTECGEPVEALQKFTDAPLTECAACGGRAPQGVLPGGDRVQGFGLLPDGQPEGRYGLGSGVRHEEGQAAERFVLGVQQRLLG